MSLEFDEPVPFLVWEAEGRLGAQQVHDFDDAVRLQASYAEWAPGTVNCWWYVILARSVPECSAIIDARRAAAKAKAAA